MTPLDQARRAAVLKCFRLPPPQTMVARKSTLTNAFVSALIPSFDATAEEIDEALRILDLDPFDLRCSYCGGSWHTWDHLRPLVTKCKPTGYVTEIANLVPSCTPCNSSKGSSHWKKWMFGKAKGSPLTRRIADLELRSNRLSEYENWREPIKVDFQSVLGETDWNQYWSLHDAVVNDMKAAQQVANALRKRVEDSLHTRRRAVKPPPFLVKDANCETGKLGGNS
jgi:5-methylcytosine-specific restriction endonuclease McrA